MYSLFNAYRYKRISIIVLLQNWKTGYDNKMNGKQDLSFANAYDALTIKLLCKLGT